MSLSFTKLFSSITESTIWCEANETRLVWITMLAMADRRGRIWASIPGLANRARVSVEATETALTAFLSPDKYSRTDAFEGRRVEIIDGGWRLLNYDKYRSVMDEETIAENNRLAQQRFRDKHKSNGNPITVSSGNERSPQAEAEEEKTIAQLPNGNGAKKVRFTATQIESIYEAYPRHVGRGSAMKAIAKALGRIENDDPVGLLLRMTEQFARSPAGRRGTYTPYPATWFNDKRYSDNPGEWQKEGRL